MKEKSCGCLPTCSPCKPRCHPAVLLQWNGNYDFSGEPDIREMPGWHHRLSDWQPQTTTLIWRIRHFAGSRAWIQYKVDNCLADIADSRRSVDPDVPDAIGPVRDWRMIGIPPGWTGEILTTKYVSGSNVPTGVMVAWPWVLEVGCVICGGTQIMWPGMRRYSQVFGTGLDPCREDWAVEKTGSTEPTCKLINHGLFNSGNRYVDALSESQSILWTGDDEHPDTPPGCIPDAIIWNTSAMPEYTSIYGAYGAPDFLPCQSPFVYASSTAAGGGAGSPVTTNSTIGNLGGVFVRRNIGFTQGPNRFSQASSLDQVKFIAVTSIRPVYPLSSEIPVTSLPSSAEYAAVKSWLDSGGKTLFIDFAMCVSGEFGIAIGNTNHNDFLSAIGSSLSIDFGSGMPYGTVFAEAQTIVTASSTTTINEPPFAGEYVNANLFFLSTGLHALSPPDEAFAGWAIDDDSDFWPQLPFGAAVCGAISGGTIVCNAVLSQRVQLADETFENFIDEVRIRATWPVVAVDEMTNGSRIIACGYCNLGGVVETAGRPAIGGTGLSYLQSIFARAVSLAGLDYERLKT